MPAAVVRCFVCACSFVLVVACSGSSGTDGGAPDAGGDPASDGSSTIDWGRVDGDRPDPGPADVPAPEVDAGDDDVGPSVTCDSDAQCPFGRPHCDPVKRVCVACVQDAQCGVDRVCVAGDCAPAPCTPDLKKCSGNLVKVCNHLGTGWTSHDCSPQECFEGECVACAEGSTRCTGASVETCTAGGYYAFDHACPGVCYEGACHACVPDKDGCDGDTVVRCNADGETSTVVEDCKPDETGSVCQSGKCVSLCLDNLKLNTNIGCDYWAVDLDQVDESGADDIQFSVVVSNVHATIAAQITITNADGSVVQTGPVGAGELKVFDLPPQNVQGSTKAKLAWHVTSTLPIIAYQFNPLENEGVFSNDASMLIPTNVLGKRYRVLTWSERVGSLRAYVTVVGVGPGATSVTVTSTAKTLGGSDVQALAAGGQGTFSLEPFEVLNLETDQTFAELTGSEIVSSQPVAVFAGTMCSNVPDSTPCVGGKCKFQPGWNCSGPGDCPVTCCCDHLEEQLLPLSAWGKSYLAPKSYDRADEKDVWRLVASEDATTVVISPAVAQVPLLGAGDFFEFQSGDHLSITADKPILVGQFLASQEAPNPDGDVCVPGSMFGSCAKQGGICMTNDDCDHLVMPGDANIGDPAFTLMIPAEQFRADYLFLAPDKYERDYATFVAPQGAPVTLDGVVLAAATGEPVAATGWVVYRVSLPDGVHRVTATLPLGAYVYGYDQYVSYGYPAGANVLAINPNGL